MQWAIVIVPGGTSYIESGQLPIRYPPSFMVAIAVVFNPFVLSVVPLASGRHLILDLHSLKHSPCIYSHLTPYDKPHLEDNQQWQWRV